MTPFLPPPDARVSSDDEKENRKYSIALPDLRNMAGDAGYKEIHRDHLTSRATYLRTAKSYSLKISIYYAYGIVGACLHRKKSGRTHAVLEHMSLRELKILLNNPFTYLKSEGYREIKGNQWKLLSRAEPDKVEHDAICRWRFCNTVTGMCQTKEELDQILHVIALYDDLSFVPGSKRSSFCKQSRTECGSKCCLETLLQEIARDYHGAAGFYHGATAEYCPLVLSLAVCPHASDYWETHWKEVQNLKNHLIGLPHHHRQDVLLWLFSRGHCGSTFLDQSGHAFDYFTPGMEEAHCDYGRLLQGSAKKPDGHSICWTHGIQMGKILE